MNDSQIQQLEESLLRLEEGDLSADERSALEHRIASEPEVADYVASRMLLIAELAEMENSALDASAEKIVLLPGVEVQSKSKLKRGLAVGLVAVLVVGLGATFLFQTKEESLELVLGGNQRTIAAVSSDMPDERFVPIGNRGSQNHPELASATVAALAVAATPSLPETIDYNDHIRPILNQKCLACHGGVKKSGGVSYLFPEEAFAQGKSGEYAIVPEDPDASEMIYRITTDDEVDLMPPSDHHERLTEHEVALLHKWIEEGANFNDHWAFLPLKEPEVPEIAAARSPIDAYILDELGERKITPTPLADRYTQLRRVSLDLTGVPPTPQEITAFIEDVSEDAYEKQVDRLLASPLYGERWAAMWLDIARYSDTKGYEKDSPRSVWLYRDWLIDAFNADLPYDQFLTHQLAGDLLPNPTRDQLIATAFHRNTMNNTEGGTNDEEFRVAAVIDRVSTTFEALMGVTMNCVQCHSHPYDPIRMEEFYQVMAIFNSTTDADRDDDSPMLMTHSREDTASYAALKETFESQLETIRKDWAEDPLHEKRLVQWKKETRELYAYAWKPFPGINIVGSGGTKFAVDETGLVSSLTPPQISEKFTVEFPETTEPSTIHALKLSLLPVEGGEAGQYSHAANGIAVINSLRLDRKRDGKKATVEIATADSNAGAAGYEFSDIASKRVNKEIINAWKASLGDDGKNPWAIMTLKKPLQLLPGDELSLRISHAYPNAREEVTTRFRLEYSDDPRFATRQKFDTATIALALPEVRVPQSPFYDPPELSWLAAGAFSHPQGKALEAARAMMKQLEKTPVVVTTDLDDRYRRETHVFVGGNWMVRGEKVEPGAPASIAPWSGRFPSNRLGLAQWMTSRENALTARVAVNRFWEQLFGEGLVITVEDLGTMGAKPTYRELLDWLALDFKSKHGWSVKALLKDIVMSDAYRRSSTVSPELLAADRANHYLSRGPRFRLSAETIRDQALLAGGLLSPKMYGPPVMPLQPEGIWNSVYNKSTWKTSPGEDQHRRALYTFWKRSSPYPSMLAFDSTAREVCSPRRIRTNTPLQALVTLNDPVYVEAATSLAGLMQAESLEVEEQLRYGFLRVLSRPATGPDLDMLRSAYQDALSEGDETLALTFVARILLNLDEALTKS